MRRFLLIILLLALPCSFLSCDEEMLAALRAYQRGEITQEQFNAAVAAYSRRNVYNQTPDQTAEPADPAADAYGCTELIDTAPRGLACLHCNHLNAHYQADVLADVMLRSCVKNIAVNYLVDGTFGYDEAFMRHHLDKLNVGGRRVFATFYLLNGPAQRRYESTPIDTIGTRISPEEFRSRVIFDRAFQSQILTHVQSFEPLFHYAAQKGVLLSVVPMLEDNLSNQSFDALLNIVLAGLPADISFAIGRNPCPDCYAGNESAVPAQLFTELHTATPDFTLTDALITNDGRDASKAAELSPVRDLAESQNDMFILWDAERQGLGEGETINTPPDDRFYVVPSAATRKELESFLRGR